MNIFDPKKEIIEPIFGEGDGIAICHSSQGYGANGWKDTALLLKSQDGNTLVEIRKALREVRVTLSMEEFLERFFGLWSENAKVLAKLLGYGEEDDSEDDSEDSLEEDLGKIELLKSSKNPEEDFFKLDLETQDWLTDLQVKFEKSLLSGKFSDGAIIKNKVIPENGDNEQMTELEELKKALKELSDENLALKQEKADAEKVALIKCDDFSFVENKDGFTNLLKSQNVEVISEIMSVLNKANDLNKQLTLEIDKLKAAASEDVDMFKALSVSGETESKDEGNLDSHQKNISNVLQKRFTKKS